MATARRILLEICVASVEDALAAREGGADRLELNAALELGGLTPSLGMLVEVRRATGLPLVVMARPRPGGFAYSDAEFRALRRDIDLALENGADGVAFGVLTGSGEVDRRRVEEVVKQVGSKEAVFHRAFDVTPDPAAALVALSDLGVRRVMSSGQEESAHAGIGRLAALVAQARGRIEVLPAAGINRATVGEVLTRTGCDQLHASLRATRHDPSTAARPHIRFGRGGGPEDRYGATSAELVRELRGLIDGVRLP